MEKGKFKNLKQAAKRLTAMPYQLIEVLVKKIDSLDPRENTKQRVIAALVLLPVAIYAIFYSKNIFLFLAILVTIIMTSEWVTMSTGVEEHNKWQVIGLFYILIPVYSVIKIRYESSLILFWMFSIIWVTDIFAFFAGRILGGPKLAPKISPNKTWSGLCGGVVASALIGLLSSFMFSGGLVFFVVVSVVLSLVEQVSDLLESKFKRIFKVKDSGNIIPGHGGVLDRLDGMMLVAPIVLILMSLLPAKFLAV